MGLSILDLLHSIDFNDDEKSKHSVWLQSAWYLPFKSICQTNNANSKQRNTEHTEKLWRLGL